MLATRSGSLASRALTSVVLTALLAPLVAAVTAAPAAAATSGDVVVVRVGDGTAALSSAATATFLEEYAPDGTLVRTTPLPTAAAGANKPLTMSGSASSEGALAQSADGRYLTLGGYGAAPGTASVAGTTATAVPRVVARVDGAGAVDTTTALTDATSGNNMRAAVSDDGSRFWTGGGAGGVRYATLGATTSTPVTTSPTNVRAVGIAGGQLSLSTGSGTAGVYTVGAGLPTTTAPATLAAASASPYAFTLLDRSPAVPGPDTLYVADDSATGGVLKFSSDGTTWTARGAFRPGGAGARGVTGAVLPDGTAGLYATTSTGTGTLARVVDTAAFDAPIAASATTLATGAANTALRGVAFAPASSTPPPAAPAITTQPQDATIAAGATATLTVAASGSPSYQWYAGTAGDTANPVAGATAAGFTTPPLTATTSYWVRASNAAGSVDSRTATVTVGGAPPGGTAPTIAPTPVAPLALTLGDPDNPPDVRTVTVGDAESAPDALTINVTSDNPAVATGGSTGGGATRTLTVTPVGVGRATLTVTVSDGALTASTTFPVAVSGALPAGTKNLYGASDASTAVDLGGNTMIVGDDETNVLRVYPTDRSRYPLAQVDLRQLGLALRDADPTREIDIEAAARTGDTIYWVGSQGQNSSGTTRLNRQELFATTVTGTGATATFALKGSYQHLRDDLVAWDTANGNPLGLAAAATRAPEGSAGSPTGFNIEGAELSADGQTLYLGFRGPLVGTKALVVPVTNVAALVGANPTTGVTATFGSPLQWDLGGRGVREMRRSADGTYLIIAGPSDGGTGAAGEFRFFTWDGSAAAPVLRAGSLDQAAAPGKPEGIVSVPAPLTDASTVPVVTDSGDTAFYGDGTAAKDLDLTYRKATLAPVAVGAGPACSTPARTIGSVQGTTDVSPVAGQTVSVRGTVVSDNEGPQPALRGFSLQDAGDGDPATSDGIFVFDNGANLVSNGDVVQVSGPVAEFQGQTQITAAATGGVQPCGAQATVTPADIALPRATPADLEPYEGMLVRLHQTATVNETFQLGRFGQVVVGNGRLRQPTADIRATDRAAVTAAQNANNLNKLIIDDADQAQNPDPIVFGDGGQPLSAANTLRIGDSVTDATGVLTYTWAGNAASGNAYRLRPVGALGGRAQFDPADPRPTAPPAVGGGIKVASANLLNFFNQYSGCTFGVGGAPADCRGANNDAEYQRQLAKEVASLTFLGADVVGFMEMQNNGYGPGSAEQALVDALNAADGAGTWAFVDFDAATGVTNVAGTDAIKPGMLYKPGRVTPVAGATFVDQAGDLYERRPVAQTFTTAGGGTVTVVSNHFKSKGSCPTSGPDTDQGDGQSCWNARRTLQAQELARWIGATVVPGAGDPDVLIVGDLNSYAGEDPIATLEAAGYVNMVKQFGGNEAYSYVFDAQTGYLDHMLASASLAPQIIGVGDAHHNADEPSVLDYNTEFKTPGQVASLYAPDRFRTSDHDPVLAGLALGAASTISGTPPTGTVGQPYSFRFTTSGGGDSTAVTVAAGTLPPGLTLAADGTLSGTPTTGGTFPFTVRATGPYGSGDLATSVTVVAPPVLSGTLPAAKVGVAYATPVPYAGDRPATFTVSAGALPAGLTLSADGTVSGTPTKAGTATFTVTATNAVGAASRAYTITVAKGASTVTVTSSRNPSPLLAAVTFTATISGAGPAPGGTVTFRAGNVPLGSAVAVTGTTARSAAIAILPPGTTTVTATWSGTADATGSAGTVAQTVLLPATFVGTPPDGRVGTAYRFAFTAIGAPTFSVTTGSLPPGLTLSPAGVLSGTPTRAGTSTVTIRAANAVSSQDRTFTIRVR